MSALSIELLKIAARARRVQVARRALIGASLVVGLWLAVAAAGNACPVALRLLAGWGEPAVVAAWALWPLVRRTSPGAQMRAVAQALDGTGEVLAAVELPGAPPLGQCASGAPGDAAFAAALALRAKERALVRLRACDPAPVVRAHALRLPALLCAGALAATALLCAFAPRMGKAVVAAVFTPAMEPAENAGETFDGRLASDLPQKLQDLADLAAALDQFADQPTHEEARALAKAEAQLLQSLPSLRARLAVPALASAAADANATPMRLAGAAKSDAKALRSAAGALGGGDGAGGTARGGGKGENANARPGTGTTVETVEGAAAKRAKWEQAPVQYRELVKAYFEAKEKRK